MAQAILHQILNQLETLEIEELQQLNYAIERYLADKEGAAQQTKFYEVLLNSGLVKQLKRPSCSRQGEQQPIQVEGEPVSKTIIEERLNRV